LRVNRGQSYLRYSRVNHPDQLVGANADAPTAVHNLNAALNLLLATELPAAPVAFEACAAN